MLNLSKKSVMAVERFDASLRNVGGTRRYTYLEKLKDDNVRVWSVAVRRTKDGVMAKAIAEYTIGSGKGHIRDCGLHMIAGWMVYWTEDDWIDKAINAYRLAHTRGGGWEEFRYEPFKGLPGHEDIVVNPEVLLETRFKYCGWGERRQGDICAHLEMYMRFPKIEHLAKAGLWSLICPSVLKRMNKDRNFVRWVVANINDLKHVRPAEAVMAYLNNIDVSEAIRTRDALRELRYWMKIPEPVKKNAVKVLAWTSRADIETREYCRYICYADNAGWDLDDEHVMMPPVRSWRRRLEMAERASKEADERRERVKNRDLNNKIMKVARLLADIEGESGRYSIEIPKSKADLVSEGKAMGNCVGSMGYDVKVASGKCVIVFIRMDGKSHADMEISIEAGGIKLRQLYGMSNSRPSDEVRIIGDKVLKQVRKALKEAA